MFNEAGLAAILQFGALGLLGIFMYFSYQSYKNQIDFQQRITIRIIEVIEKNTTAHQQATSESKAICKGIEDNRTMEKEEHKALMAEHKILMEDHRHITKKLAV